MVTSVTGEGPLCLPDAVVQAVTRHAERQADLAGTYLRSSGLYRTGELRFPAAALLELAAVLELGVWERRGLRRHLNVDLPTFREAADQLVARCMKGSAEFTGSDVASLSHRVLRVWIEHFAWDGPDLLNADVVVGDVDEDVFIDVLAEFVWNHRNELAQLLRIEGNKK